MLHYILYSTISFEPFQGFFRTFTPYGDVRAKPIDFSMKLATLESVKSFRMGGETKMDKFEKKRIAVFDFRAKDCVHTAEAIRQYYRQRGITAEVVEFMATQPFAFDFKANGDAGTPYDMTFIGVDSIMGMETARNIRELDTQRPMFLVSEVSDYGLEGFRLRVLDYLTKPVSPQRIGQAVERIR